MPPPTQSLDLLFPYKGINEIAPAQRPAEMATHEAQNVRPYDAISGRQRGGQRRGLSKYFDSALNAGNMIQQLDYFISAFGADDIVADELKASDDFTAYSISAAADDQLGDQSSDWTDSHGSSSSLFATAIPGDGLNVEAGNKVSAYAATHSFYGARYENDINPGSAYIIKATVEISDAPAWAEACAAVLAFRLDQTDDSDPDHLFVRFQHHDASPDTVKLMLGSTGSFSTVTETISNTLSDWRGERELEVHVNGNQIQVYLDDVKYIEESVAEFDTQDGFGIGVFGTGVSQDNPKIHKWAVYTGVTPASRRRTHLVAVSGGSIYVGDAASGMSLASGGSGVMATSEATVQIQGAFQKAYFCDGYSSHYRVYDPDTSSVTRWESSDSGALMPNGRSTSSYSVTGVNTGTDTFTVAEDLSSLEDGDYIEISGSTGNDGVYTVASTSGAGPTDITVDQDVTDATADGTLYLNSVGCRLMCLYRGRIVLSGLSTEPQNWFMSAVGDPEDWDYSPATPSATQAVAGNASDLGELADVVTALIPYSDDMLVIGGDHTLWIMRGDPAAGGAIDAVSYDTGVAGAEAWAFDPNGVLYFFGAGTLWRMQPGGGMPEPVSRGRLDETFGDINYGDASIRLLWDVIEHGLHIYLTPMSEPSTEQAHWFWDQRTDSFWKDVMPDHVGPTAAAVYDADDPDDRAALLGGWDSYIRYLDSSAKDDDGESINSFVAYPIQVLAGDAAKAKISRITPILATGSDPVRLEVYAANDAETLEDETTPKITRTLQAGRNPPLVQRVVGNALMVRLEDDDAVNDYQWAVESLAVEYSVAGRQRQGVS